ncbi:branched-chain amino acid ABC transporter [Burkholderia latens]|uniref:branched-chain amino acid ABC transporter n=1 Tax=Burkholderia latens TaxID=488446 RepID=UPI00158E3927|nr:branched-chain amino acid ABC transporter [Burkholderia latens]
MHVKLAYAKYVAAPVAMLAGDGKTSDDTACREAAAHAVPVASDMRAAGAGRAAPSACRIAQSDSDKDNGARLTIDAFNAQGSKIGMHSTRHAARAGGVAIDRATGTPVARQRAAGRPAAAARVERRALGFRGNAGNVQMSPIPSHFDSTKRHVAAACHSAAGGLLRFTNSDAVLTTVGRHLRVARSGAARAAANGIGAQTLGGNGMCAVKVVEPAGDAVQNLICPVARFAAARTEKGSEAGKPDAGRFGTLPYDFKEAKTTVLDVVTI